MFYTKSKESELIAKLERELRVTIEKEVTERLRKEMDEKIVELRAEIYAHIEENSLAYKMKKGKDDLVHDAKQATKEVAEAATKTLKKIKKAISDEKNQD